MDILKSIVVVTCKDRYLAITMQNIFNSLHGAILYKNVKILCIEDPDTKFGSGSATFNALLYSAEFLSSNMGHNVITSEILENCLILIMHLGDNYLLDPLGKAFTINSKHCIKDFDNKIVYMQTYNIIHLINTILGKLSNNYTLKGVWVCGTSMHISIPNNIEIQETKNCLVLTIPQTLKYAKSHGAYKIDAEGFVEAIIYKGSSNQISKCKIPYINTAGDNSTYDKECCEVPIVVGLIYFPVPLAQTLLYLNTKPPLDCSTYMGRDRGVSSLKLTLFFDLLYPMYGDSNESLFASPQYDNHLENEVGIQLIAARKLLWHHLSPYKVRAVFVEDARCDHLTTPKVYDFLKLYNTGLTFRPDHSDPGRTNHSIIRPDPSFGDMGNDGLLFNTLIATASITIGNGSLLKNCSFENCSFSIGEDCYFYGLQINGQNLAQRNAITIPNNTTILLYHVRLKILKNEDNHVMSPLPVPIFLGTTDIFEIEYYDATYMNIPFVEFMRVHEIAEYDLWPCNLNKGPLGKTLYTARLFPFLLQQDLSLQPVSPSKMFEILDWIIPDNTEQKSNKIFSTEEELYQKISEEMIVQTLYQNRARNLEHLYVTSCLEGFTEQTLQKLDEVAEKICEEITIKNQPDLNAKMKGLGKLARTLSNTADFLDCWAGPDGGLKSGPAANLAWKKGLDSIKRGAYATGLWELKHERVHWLNRPDLLIRAARHYAATSQLIIGQQVSTADHNVMSNGRMGGSNPTPLGRFILVRAPARLDLAGGWTDTPPICYESGTGGCVVNLAITIDGHKPIGALGRNIEKSQIRLFPCQEIPNLEKLKGLDINEMAEGSPLIFSNSQDFVDIQPQAPGAIVKAACLFAGVVDTCMLQSGCGMEIYHWSTVPEGSGLGTSTILAACVLALIWTLQGKNYAKDELVHAILILEQILTTGGGWQDQVGGIYGGAKAGFSGTTFPLTIKVLPLPLDPGFEQFLNDRLLLVYTGKARLARNILQEVIRNWYCKDRDTMTNVDHLCQTAVRCKDALLNGNIELLSSAITDYRYQKLAMAPRSSEPTSVKALLNFLSPYSHTLGLAGAGGGGFIYAILRDPNLGAKIRRLLCEESRDAKVFDAKIDTTGLVVKEL